MAELAKRTDPEEKRLVPMEILTEFLTCIMLKDYKKALPYCVQILTYEPSNETAKEFYPLILQKLEMIKNDELEKSESSDSDSTSSITKNGHLCNDSEDMESSSDSSESDWTAEEFPEDFRSQSTLGKLLRETSGKTGASKPSISRNQETKSVVSSDRILNKGCKTRKRSPPRLAEGKTTTKITGPKNKAFVNSSGSSPIMEVKKCKQRESSDKNNHIQCT